MCFLRVVQRSKNYPFFVHHFDRCVLRVSPRGSIKCAALHFFGFSTMRVFFFFCLLRLMINGIFLLFLIGNFAQSVISRGNFSQRFSKYRENWLNIFDSALMPSKLDCWWSQLWVPLSGRCKLYVYETHFVLFFKVCPAH